MSSPDIFSVVSRKDVLTGIEVMFLSNVEICMLPDTQVNEEDDTSNCLMVMDNRSDLHLCCMLIETCLQNPYWSEFRLLDFFCKRGIPMTMKKLQYLRRECGLESRDDVCQELIRLYSQNEIQLDKRQIQFIERVNPAFRDRDFWATRPGDLLAYECVFFRRLNKMFYIHVLVDLFNGHVFGKVSRRRSGDIALELLQEKIVPFYRERGYMVSTVIHSTKSARDCSEAEESNIHQSVLAMGIEWLEPQREFGIIQCFQRDVLEEFFCEAEALEVSLFRVQPALDRWMIQYNASSPFHQRRNLFGYLELVENRHCM